MGNCIRTPGVLLDGALWNVYIQTLAIVVQNSGISIINRSFFIFIELTVSEMFEQVLTLGQFNS